MGKYSFIGDLVQGGSKAAKEVIEGSGKTANNRAKMIKNCVNTVKSNIGSGQAKAISEIGEDSGRALKEGIQNALDQTNAKTAQRALNKAVAQSGTPTQVSKDFINNKTVDRAIRANVTGNSAIDTAVDNVRSKNVNKVIDGHNAQQRDVEMQTIFNNVQDRNINRVPKDHSAARESVEQANTNVRNAINRKKEWLNNDQRGPINTGNYQMNAGPEASPIIRNQEIPDVNTSTNSAQQRYYRTQTESDVNTNRVQTEVEPEFDFNNRTVGAENTGGPNTEQRSNRAKERMNRAFNEKFDNFKDGAKDTFFGGIVDSYDNITNGEQGILEGIRNAHFNDDGSLNLRRAAGTFATTSAAARVVSGGGLYKDRYGNPNLIGVPFI